MKSDPRWGFGGGALFFGRLPHATWQQSTDTKMLYSSGITERWKLGLEKSNRNGRKGAARRCGGEQIWFAVIDIKPPNI
jgi:hypothetical protein